MSKEAKDTEEQEDPKGQTPAEETKEPQEPKEAKEPKEKHPKAPKEENGKEEQDRKIEETEQKLAEMNDKYLRLSAEFDNFRKRTLKEKMELVKSAGEQILEKILPVMDNFERALKSMETAEDVPALRKGVELIYAHFKDFLSQQGVKEIECLHANFDPELQEAVTKIPAPSEDLKGKVVDCVQKGYVLHDKVIRFPKVVVGE